jgi:predicted nucleic acid-binding protein
VSFVIDASVIFAWQFPDEDHPLVKAVVAALPERGAIVPIHWKAEIANGFAVAVRRKRMPSDYRDGALLRLRDLPIEIDAESESRLWTDTQVLCDRHALTAYDASYLEVAMRRDLPLASLDKALVNAAAAEGVQLFRSGE